MAGSHCVSLVLYESRPELVEAARAVVANSTLFEIRTGGWEELRTATDLDVLLARSNLTAHERYGLAARWHEAAIANVEWTREITKPVDMPIHARWLASPPRLAPDLHSDDANARYRA